MYKHTVLILLCSMIIFWKIGGENSLRFLKSNKAHFAQVFYELVDASLQYFNS